MIDLKILQTDYFEKDLKEKTKRSITEKRLNNFRTMIEKSIRKREEENYINPKIDLFQCYMKKKSHLTKIFFFQH